MEALDQCCFRVLIFYHSFVTESLRNHIFVTESLGKRNSQGLLSAVLNWKEVIAAIQNCLAGHYKKKKRRYSQESLQQKPQSKAIIICENGTKRIIWIIEIHCKLIKLHCHNVS